MTAKKKKNRKRTKKLGKARAAKTARRKKKRAGIAASGQIPSRKPPTFIQVNRDVPLVEDGFRIVGPAQAMSDYSKPLHGMVGEKGSMESIQKSFEMTNLLWNIAIGRKHGDPDDSLERQLLKLMRNNGIERPEDILEMMVERHYLMFPETELSETHGGFYMREKVVDPVPDYDVFDEASLDMRDDPMPPEKQDAQLASDMRSFNAAVMRDDDLWRELKDDLTDRLFERFSCWAEFKGLTPPQFGRLSFGVERFFDFITFYCGETIENCRAGSVSEFMRTLFIRKNFADPGEMSAMPAGMKLFTAFLEEMEIAEPSPAILTTVESERDTFLNNLYLYCHPEEAP